MNLSVEICMIIAAVMMLFDLFLLAVFAGNRIALVRRKKQNNYLELLSGNKYQDVKDKVLVSNYLEVKKSIQFATSEMINAQKSVSLSKVEKRHLKQLKSIFKASRIEAAVNLGLLGTEKARLALEAAIILEKDYPVKLYMANALSDINNEKSIPVLISTLINAHRWYRNRVNMLISDFGGKFNEYLPNIINNEFVEIKELITDFASVYYSDYAKNYLINLLNTREEGIKKLHTIYGESAKEVCANCMHSHPLALADDRVCKYKGIKKKSYHCFRHAVTPISVDIEKNYNQLVYKAADILAQFYPSVLDSDEYLKSDDIILKNIAVKGLINLNSRDNISKLFYHLKHEDTYRSAVNALSKIIERNAYYIPTIVSRFTNEHDQRIRQRLAEILSSRIEYFIMKLATKNGKPAADILKQILILGRTSEVIDFLSKNKDIDIENELIVIIKEVLSVSPVLKKDFSGYLSIRLAKKCGITNGEELLPEKEEKKDRKLVLQLSILLVLTIFAFPAIYLLRYRDILLTAPLWEQLKIFVIDFNYYLAFYSVAINLIYFALLILSLSNVNQQSKLWKNKSKSLLFKKKMLPSISVIAPAFNEEKTIIESSNSLLNLIYPDYELIIVNDGSKDNTLDVLIKYFDLIRVDFIFDYKLNTKPVRGIYMNRSMPKLIVVDKENGGKADSLNAGINISNKEYFCGIDADSLLEDEALLKLASLTLDEGIETPALGGNIFPINGCKIERGQIVDVQIPQNTLARFQTIEYIRAFMAGRLGWARMNSLLIISGAFGLFRKERVVSVGGYLTSSGKYAKDTVGEDMELVVRISRLMRELGRNYRICYAYNANCWTEVPEDLTSLKKQRYRWHKGLIEILTFHKRMLFSPAYGRTGLLALPYFLVFEMIGPLIEIQGYIMVLIAIVLGLINMEIALLLFISTILMGILMSVSSLMIAEKDTKYFKLKDLMVLVLYAILENFGPRQLFSLWRVGGLLNILKKPTGWGKPQRKGFTTPKTDLRV